MLKVIVLKENINPEKITGNLKFVFFSSMNAVEMKTFSKKKRQDLPPVFLFLQKPQRLLFFMENKNVPRWKVGEAGRKKQQ